MDIESPQLYASLTRTPEVRHLIWFFDNGPAKTRLVQFSGGVETPIATGTQYEMEQEALVVLNRWKEEGFDFPGKKQPVFERLDWTIALTMKLGHTHLIDPSLQQLDRLPLNPTGLVPLAKWTGMSAKNGGSYEYALDHMTLCASPRLPPNHELLTLIPPIGTKEFVAYLLAYTEAAKAVGPTRNFVLVGQI